MDKNAHEAFRTAGNIEIIANGVDLDYFKPQQVACNPKKIVYLGNFHSFPNRDGVLFFYEKIFPQVLAAIPDVQFYIVGINPPEKLLSLKDDKNIFITKDVEDIRIYLRDAAALVCPLRVGAGIQNKILEAMAMGIPVVTTTLGTLWLSEEGKKTVLIADSPCDFAAELISLMKSAEKRNMYAQQGRLFVEKYFSWELNMNKLEILIKRKDSN